MKPTLWVPPRRPVLRPRLGQQASPNLQELAELLRRQGAIVDIAISTPQAAVQAQAQQGQAARPGQTVRGLVDTGASISTVSEEVAAQVGLVQTGTVQLGGVGGSGTRPVYAARMHLPQYGVTVDPIEIAGVSIPFADVQILLGRDVLRQVEFRYLGPAGSFGLSTEEGGAAAPGAPGAGSPVAVPALIGAAVGAGITAALFAFGVFD